MKLAAALVAVGLAAAGSAGAQEWSLYAGTELEYLTEPGGADGGDSARLSGYVEAESNGFYLGVWGRVDSVSVANEIDLYLGYRQSLDSGFDYSLSYTRYIYPNDGGDCCGEIGVTVGQTLGDQFYVYSEAYYDPEAELGSVYAGAEFYATDAITLSGSFGLYNATANRDETEWDLGASYALGEETALDLRYYEGSEYDGYVGLSVTFDTTLFGG
jgi:uncharacterized protein (TIGR02001 family)